MARSIPLVLPVVVFQGPGSWTGGRSLADLAHVSDPAFVRYIRLTQDVSVADTRRAFVDAVGPREGDVVMTSYMTELAESEAKGEVKGKALAYRELAAKVLTARLASRAAPFLSRLERAPLETLERATLLCASPRDDSALIQALDALLPS